MVTSIIGVHRLAKIVTELAVKATTRHVFTVSASIAVPIATRRVIAERDGALELPLAEIAVRVTRRIIVDFDAYGLVFGGVWAAIPRRSVNFENFVACPAAVLSVRVAAARLCFGRVVFERDQRVDAIWADYVILGQRHVVVETAVGRYRWGCRGGGRFSGEKFVGDKLLLLLAEQELTGIAYFRYKAAAHRLTLFYLKFEAGVHAWVESLAVFLANRRFTGAY